MQTENYDIAQGIDHGPPFNRWVRHTLKKCDRIIYFVHKWKTRYLKKTQKFGIVLLKTVYDAHDLDNNNGNTLWYDEIAKEMKNVNIDFDIMPDGERLLNGYKHISLSHDIWRENGRLQAQGKTCSWWSYK